jgi:hypothetical protein
MMIDDCGCIIRSTQSTEFILHFPTSSDLRMSCERRDDFLNLMKLMFAKMQPSITLRVYGIVSFLSIIIKLN